MSEGSKIGIVLIGRNEGDRLVRALDAVCDDDRQVVYVDSGSTDNSVGEATTRGATVVSLDMSIPFTAARARNAGFDRLCEVAPDVRYVQFIDGDCEVAKGWIDSAIEVLDSQAEIVAVCGFRRERYPERTLYNRMCDVEWRNGPLGLISCFGGDVMVRSEALQAIGGYNPELIAGEDEEVGIRLRHAGGKLLRINHTSTLHDADINRFGQWWQRAKRCGHAYAQLNSMYGKPPEKKFTRELRRTYLWGAFVPGAAVGMTVPTLGLSWLMLGVYPLRVARTTQVSRRRGLSWPDALAWGLNCTLSPIPEAFGVAKYYLDRIKGKRSTLIEYK